MKAQLVRFFVPISFCLVSMMACSDPTQFAEQVIPSGSQSPEDTTTLPDQPNSTKTTGKTRGPDVAVPTAENTPEDPSLDPNETASGTVYDGMSPSAPESNPPDDAGQSLPASKAVFSSCERSSAPIVAQVYTLANNTSQLPDFSRFSPVDEVCLDQLDITDRPFTEGFPGVPDLIEWFGLDLHFRVYAPSQGAYTFTLRSDDGSILTLDGKTLVNNDGLHEVKEKAGVVALTKGYHDVHIRYYQGPRYRIALELMWTLPGLSNASYIPKAYLARPL